MVQVQHKGEVGAAADLITNRVQAMWATTSRSSADGLIFLN